MSIKISNLSFTYLPNTPNSYEALHDVSFTIPSNSFTGIVGHTGSGKSTLVQMLNGLLKPEKGIINIDDKFIIDGSNRKKLKNIKELRKHVGLVFQFPEYQLFEETVEKDVAFGPRNFGASEEESIKKAHETLSLLGLDESYYKRSPFELSGGEKRKVALAGILAIDPEILILDEPSAGLDPINTKEVMNIIDDLHKKGKTIIMITHDMDLLYRYADHVIVMKDGKLAYEGDIYSLFNNLDEDLAIETPMLYQFIKILKTKGLDLDPSKIRTFRQLISAIKEAKGDKHE